MSVWCGPGLILGMAVLIGTAGAAPAATSAANDLSLPKGWSFLNDPSPLLPRKAMQERGPEASKGTEQGAPVLKTDGASGGKTQPGATGLWLPLGERTPVAAFRKGNRLVIVAGGRHPLDTAALIDTAPFGSVQSQMVGGATMIRMTCPEGALVTLRPAAGGWSVSLAPTGEAPSQMQTGQEGAALTFDPPAPDDTLQVLTFQDPDSGRRLLLGLSQFGHVTSTMARRGDGFEVRPSLMGVVVAADSDAMELRQASGKFFLDRIGPGNLPLLAQGKLSAFGASMAGVHLGEVSPDTLQADAYHAWISAVTAIAGQRFDARMRLAQAMARLANGPQLSQILQTALEDQPEGIARADVKRLRQISAVLNARSAPDLQNEEEGAAPEDQFWRGMVRTLPSKSSLPLTDQDRGRAAKLIAAGFPSVLSYAKPLRQRLLSPAAEWIVRYGDDQDRAAFHNLPEVPETALAHALLAARDHAPDAAQKLGTLSQSASPMVWPVAQEAALRLSLETGKMSPKVIGEKLDTLMPAFRMAGREREARLLSVDAFLQAGEWRAAQQAIQDGQAMYGDRAFPGPDRLAKVALGLASAVSIKPEDALAEVVLLKKALAVAGDNQENRINFLKALSTRYATLGLPAAQKETLQALRREQTGEDAEKTDLQIARLELESGDTVAALRALPPELPSGVAALPGGHVEPLKTVLLRTRAALASHDSGKALEYLKDRLEPEALEMKADILEQQKDWKGATIALKTLLQEEIASNEKGPLTSVQSALVLRLGADASRANEGSILTDLKKQFSTRMEGQSSAAMFQFLTGREASSIPHAGG